MKEDKQIRWGIIGLGNIANSFASDLQFVPNAILQGVASRNLNKAKAFKIKYTANSAYGNYKTLVEDPNIDIVYIATPHIFHFEISKLCIEYGKAVLCEKPMGMSANQVIELCGLANKNKVFLMEAMWTAFLPNFNRLKKIIHSNELGKIISFKADFGFKAPYEPNKRLFNKNLGGGSLLDIGIYPIFAALTLLGIPKSISGDAVIGKTAVDESCNLNFNYSNSLNVELNATLLENTPTEIHIKFEHGIAVLGPNFYSPSNLKIIDAHNRETIFPKNNDGYGYQFEAIHAQKLLSKNCQESPIMSHKKSIELATYLDRSLMEIGITYDI